MTIEHLVATSQSYTTMHPAHEKIDKLPRHLACAMPVATCRKQTKSFYASLTIVKVVSKLHYKLTDLIIGELLKRRRAMKGNIEGGGVSDAISGTQLNPSFCQKYYMAFRSVLAQLENSLQYMQEESSNKTDTACIIYKDDLSI